MSDCLSATDFEQFHFDRIDTESKERIRNHLAGCTKCLEAFEHFKRDESLLAKAASILDSISIQKPGFSDLASRATIAHHLPRIDGYEVQRLIGRGGMAAVYEAVQTKLNRTVALKLLPAVAGSAQPSLVTRFRREANAAAKLHHTNIIPIYDFGESRDGYYYAMELICGPTLREMIRRLAAVNAPNVSGTQIAALVHTIGTNDEEISPDSLETQSDPSSGGGTSSTTARGKEYYRQVTQWVSDVASALHFAHVSGVIHRDIKPANLILSTDGRIMVADFGLAKTTGDESVTMSGSLLGTYRYMSPEQIGAKRLKVDARTDVYSLGATLYELLAFQPAFPALDREELFGQIMFREPTPPRKIIPAVPAELQTICLKAMEKSPDARYETALAMAEDLRRFNEDLPIVARPVGILGRTRKLVRRRRAATLTLAVIVIASIVSALIFAQKLASDRRTREALLAKGAAHYNSGQYQQAVDANKKVLQSDPDNYRALANLASARKGLFYNTGDDAILDEAFSNVEHALRVCPARSHPAILSIRSVLERARGDYEASVATLMKAFELGGNDYHLYVNLGTTYALMGKLKESAPAFTKGLRLVEASGKKKEVEMAWRNLAAVQLQLREPAVFDTLAKAQEKFPANRFILLLSARAFLEIDGHHDAERALRYAITADIQAGPQHQDPQIKRTLAWAEAANDRWNESRKSASSALKFGDACTSAALLIRAWAAAEMGDKKSAQSDYERALSVWPEEMKTRGFDVQEDHDKSVIWIESGLVLEELRQTTFRALSANLP